LEALGKRPLRIARRIVCTAAPENLINEGKGLQTAFPFCLTCRIQLLKQYLDDDAACDLFR